MRTDTKSWIAYCSIQSLTLNIFAEILDAMVEKGINASKIIIDREGNVTLQIGSVPYIYLTEFEDGIPKNLIFANNDFWNKSPKKKDEFLKQCKKCYEKAKSTLARTNLSINVLYEIGLPNESAEDESAEQCDRHNSTLR